LKQDLKLLDLDGSLIIKWSEIQRICERGLKFTGLEVRIITTANNLECFGRGSVGLE
jgi:hypothetical protein